jgi:hypothetical protein
MVIRCGQPANGDQFDIILIPQRAPIPIAKKLFTSHIPCYIVTPLVKKIPLLACDQNANHFLKHKVYAAYVSST